MKFPIALISSLSISPAAAKRTNFWQWTDPHTDITNECAGNTTEGAKYGNFDNSDSGCGSTPALLDSALDYMKTVDATEGKPDFIFFTGDSPWGSSPEDSESVIKALITSKYPDTPLFFCIGNHDVIGDMNPSGDDNKPLYHETAALWGDYLDDDAKATFSASGWYSQKISDKVKLVVLNTEYYDYGNDEVLKGNTYVDGFAQYEWLRSELQKAKDDNMKVYLFGHIPPGYECGYANDNEEQGPPGSMRPYMPDLFVRKFSDITDEFADTIAVTIHGHEHVDTFRLVGQKSHHYSVPGLTSAYPRSNPTIRMWVHDMEEGEVPDYKQYHFDLVKSNKDEVPYWDESYVFSEKYGYNTTRRESLEDLLVRFKAEHDDPSVSTVWAEHNVFYSGNTPKKYQPICDTWCQVQKLCDMNYGAAVITYGNIMSSCLAWEGFELFKDNEEL